jgi:hypothetical protein
MSDRTPVIRRFTLPNGDVIVSLRESTLRAGINAANAALRLGPTAQKIANGLNDVIEGRYLPITPSSGCVFFDLSVPCEQDGCVVCPRATPGASTPSAAPTTHPDPLDAPCACGEGTIRGCVREPGVGCGAWREDSDV